MSEKVQNATPAWSLTKLSGAEEVSFQRWIRSLPFWREFVSEHGEEPNLQGDYDYRGAFKSFVSPERDPFDNRFHWPSVAPSGQWLKSPYHPTAWKEWQAREIGFDPESFGALSKEAGRGGLSK